MNNKTIVALLAVALVVSLTGTIMSVNEISKVGGQWLVISGAVTSSATDTGNTTLEILANVGLSVDDFSIDLGSGYVNSSVPFATIDTGETVETQWLNSTNGIHTINDGHTLNNTGSTTVNISVAASVSNADEWLCGDATGATCPGNNSWVKVYIADSTFDACFGFEKTTAGTFLTHNTVIPSVLLCGNMMPNDGQDQFRVNYVVRIPQEAPTGTKTATFTYTAEAK
ncbi:hypothetical protein HN385_06940 [archaeon]|jgi:hypothetical protein|nr:hypothetical protein [archaeon]MBT3451009.1 hypothetical protein [archaeon]MBT6868571.1 hypothetical protein [archaeon]MBT7193103.1 hypothetical protein [archaeon]MBT7380420.1 hypothetical protein [archaeon]